MRGFRISARTAGIVAAIGVAGCATMIRGTHESLDLVSTPTGARADLSTGQSCITPCAQNIARDASFSVTFSKDGCDSQTIAVFPTLAGAGVLFGRRDRLRDGSGLRSKAQSGRADAQLPQCRRGKDTCDDEPCGRCRQAHESCESGGYTTD
jgi:hypothetical protein